MDLEYRVRAILEEHNLAGHGVVQRIADEVVPRLNRHTVSKIVNNTGGNVALETLGRICDWLVKQGVPAEGLPARLIGVRPSELWKAMAEPGEVTIHLGEYRAVPPAPAPRLISRRDAAVAGAFVELLSSPDVMGPDRPTVHTRYVPFRHSEERLGPGNTRFQGDIKKARTIFERMSAKQSRGSWICVGSQQVNYLVEILVADLYGCQPFRPPVPDTGVPFYMVYRPRDRALPSCFGGHSAPPGRKGHAKPGIYYRRGDGSDAWESIEWEENERDGAIVITIRDPGRGKTGLVSFGLSGRGTAAVGQQLAVHPDMFWEAETEIRGPREVRIYLCEIILSGDVTGETDEDLGVESVEVREQLVC